jgi:AcrR family transcriptional regulator
MGIAERREREKEALQTRILEAARDILSEEGLDGLSMRAIADRIEYSAGTIYTYFRDKDELIRAVVRSGFERLNEYTQAEIEADAQAANPVQQFAAMGRAYARFALENTAYFRVMFELPAAAQLDCPYGGDEQGCTTGEEPSFDPVVDMIQRAIDAELVAIRDASRGAVIGWGLIHGMTSLYLSGHLRDLVKSHEEFLELVVEAQASLYVGWRPAGGVDAMAPTETVDAVVS